MPRVITTLQAMSHPTVVETINCLSEMSQRLQDENDALRAALAQPEQEPVAREQFHEHMAGSFYTPPPQRPWVGLTDEEHNAIYNQCQGVRVGSAISLTEAKLKEKNT